MDDSELMREYAACQSEDAFKALVDRHLGFVYAAALRQLRDPHLAEEATQVVFTILARKAGTLPARTVVSGWLYRTTRFVVLDIRKAESRRKHREQEVLQTKVCMQENQSDEQWNQIWPLLDDGLMRLGEGDRHAVLLRFFEGYSFRQVGDALAISENTAQKRVARALEKLRAFVGKNGITATSAVLVSALSMCEAHSAPLEVGAIARIALAANTAVASPISALVSSTLKVMTIARFKTAALVGGGLIVSAVVSAVAFAVVLTACAGPTTKQHKHLLVEAEQYLSNLKRADKLPGFRSGEHGIMQVHSTPPFDHASMTYPLKFIAEASKQGDTSRFPFYRYELSKSRPDSPWHLDYATRVDGKGQAVVLQ